MLAGLRRVGDSTRPGQGQGILLLSSDLLTAGSTGIILKF